MVSLAKKNEKKPFHLIASHAQNSDQATISKLARDMKLDPDSPNFTITSFSSHPDVKSNGIPYVAVFDHTGTIIFKGRPSDMDPVIQTALKKVPAFYIGELKYSSEKIKSFGAQVEERKSLGKVLGKLEEIIAEGEDATEKEEAADLAERLKARFGQDKDRYLEMLDGQPAEALAGLKALAKEMKGSTFGNEVQALHDEKKADPAVKKSIPVSRKFASYRGQYEKLLKGDKIPEKKRGQVDAIIKKLNKLADDNSDLPIAEAIREWIAEIK